MLNETETLCCEMFRMEKQRSLEAIRQCRKWVLKQKPKNNKKLKTRDKEHAVLDARDLGACVSL